MGWRGRIRSEKGAQAVEMIFVLILLLLIMVGVIDFGRAFNNYIIITNASREGARIAARLPCVDGDATQLAALKATIQNAAILEAANSGITLGTGDIAITPDPVDSGCPAYAGNPILVEVSYSYTPLIRALALINGNFNSNLLTLRSATRMAWFGSDTY